MKYLRIGRKPLLTFRYDLDAIDSYTKWANYLATEVERIATKGQLHIIVCEHLI